jgi:hypothetical protein
MNTYNIQHNSSKVYTAIANKDNGKCRYFKIWGVIFNEDKKKIQKLIVSIARITYRSP